MKFSVATASILTWFGLVMFSVPASADLYVETQVGSVLAAGNANGANMFTRADGSAFPGCTASATQMWAGDPNYSYSDAGMKSILSILLTAKALGGTVGVYYAVDNSGYCRYHLVTIK